MAKSTSRPEFYPSLRQHRDSEQVPSVLAGALPNHSFGTLSRENSLSLAPFLLSPRLRLSRLAGVLRSALGGGARLTFRRGLLSLRRRLGGFWGFRRWRRAFAAQTELQRNL